MTSHRLSAPLLALCALLAEGGEAAAHPHVWIDAHLSLTLDAEERLTRLQVRWTMDELYSQVAVDGLDTNGDGLYAPDELSPLIADAMVNLKEWFYFTDIRADGERLPTREATDYEAHMDGDRLVYRFTLPLEHPLRPGPDGVTIRLFDPSLYIGVELLKKRPVSLDQPSESCQYRVLPAPGMEEALMMSESLFAQEVEPGTDGPGGRFAERVVLTCD